MTTYNEAFGTVTVPSSDSRFSSYSLTASQTFDWTYNQTGAPSEYWC